MDKYEKALPEAATARGRIILTMGGKGGVGKTSFMLALADWFDSNGIEIHLLRPHGDCPGARSFRRGALHASAGSAGPNDRARQYPNN